MKFFSLFSLQFSLLEKKNWYQGTSRCGRLLVLFFVHHRVAQSQSADTWELLVLLQSAPVSDWSAPLEHLCCCIKFYKCEVQLCKCFFRGRAALKVRLVISCWTMADGDWALKTCKTASNPNFPVDLPFIGPHPRFLVRLFYFICRILLDTRLFLCLGPIYS